jgi:hypothetical protein
MECAFNGGVLVAEFEGAFRVALHNGKFGVAHCNTGKYLVADTECQQIIVEGEIFGNLWQRKTVFAKFFDVHW